jgi:endonuclease YncB( thermonuclease family)
MFSSHQVSLLRDKDEISGHTHVMEDIYFILVLVSLVCLVVGLIKPSAFSRFLQNEATRGKTSLIFSLAMITFFVLFGITSDKNEAVRQAETAKQTALLAESRPPQGNQAAMASETGTVVPSDTATEIVSAVEEVKKTEETFEVERVIDGDTLTLNMNGKKETLRLIGMDTPETVDPRKPVQCFAKEASAKAKEMLTGKRVRIEADPSQGERDKYNRLLRYIFLEDGTFFNKVMIEDGYAHEYTYNIPYRYQSEFKEAETRARESKRGLWGDVCNGDTMQSASSVESHSPAPTQALVAPVAPKASSGYTCNCSKTCANMSSCSEAQYQLNTCGCSARDADDDGIACDSDCQ